MQIRGGGIGDQSRIINIYCIYNPSPSLTYEGNPSCLPTVKEQLEKEGEHILLGDFNLYHPNWNNPSRFTYHKEADEVITMTMNRDIELLLPKGTVTWKARRCESTVDLIFATPEVAASVHRCQVVPELRHSSNHLPILTEFGLHMEEAPVIPRRAWKTAKPKKVGEEAAKVSNSLPLRPLVDEESIDDYVADLSSGMVRIIEAAVPWAKPAKRIKSFWDQDCSRVVTAARSLAGSYNNNRSVDTDSL